MSGELAHNNADPTVVQCVCTDPQVDELRSLIAAGMSQWDASLAIWSGRPGDDIRIRVRAAYARAFPWLVLPPLGGAS